MDRRDVLLLPAAIIPALILPPDEGRRDRDFILTQFSVPVEPEDIIFHHYAGGYVLLGGAPGLMRKSAEAFRTIEFRPSGHVSVRFYERDMSPWAGNEDGEDFLIEVDHLFPNGRFKEGREKVIERAAMLCFSQYRRRKMGPIDVSQLPHDWSVNDYLHKRMQEEAAMKRAVISRLWLTEIRVLGSRA